MTKQKPRRLSSGGLSGVLPPGGMTLVSGCSAESDLLSAEVALAGPALGAMDFTGIFVPGLNKTTWDAGKQSRLTTFFRNPSCQRSGPVRFLPLCYQDIGRFLDRERPGALLVMLSPPDEDGLCSFGTEVSFPADIWQDIPIRVAHINPLMPRTRGSTGIPFSELSAYFEGDEALKVGGAETADDTALKIAAHAATLIPDGTTLQTGIGKIPDAVLGALVNHRHLRLHSGLVGNGVLHLLHSDALEAGQSITGGVAIGSQALYESLGNDAFVFRPPSITHDLSVLAAIDNLVTINSAMTVDLFGQVHAESSARGFVSGPGGASDYARAARASKNGLRIIALPSAAGATSRIVAPASGIGPVSLSRFDTDIIITEFGTADLRFKDYAERARALIDIAAPEHREALSTSWHDIARTI